MVDQEIIDLPNDDGMPPDLSLFLPLQITPGSTRRRSLSNVLANTGALAPKILHVSSEQDLIDKFGDPITIPDGEAWTVILDESFTLTKPFLIGDGSSLEVKQASLNTSIAYTGTGALFQNENSANPIFALLVNNMAFFGNAANSIYDIIATRRVVTNTVDFFNFESIGIIESPFIGFLESTAGDIQRGIVIKNSQGVVLDTFNVFNQTPASPPLTFITIISTAPTVVAMRNCFIFDTGSEAVFFDPNAPTGSSFIIDDTSGFFTNLFQQGTDIAIDSVADNGSGDTRHTTASPHGLEIGQAVVISGFATETTYNGTFIVTAIPTSTTFDVEVAFNLTDTGNMNESSLDSTDVIVSANSNVGSPDSMFTANAGLEIFGSEVTTTINTINVPEVVTSASWASAALERFIDGVANQGQVIAQDTATRRYTVEFSGTLEKSGGGAVDVGLVILKNGTNISFNPPHTVNTGKIQISGQDIVELTSADTVDVAVINYQGTSDIIVSQLSLVINLA